jgi:hypothetical protein
MAPPDSRRDLASAIALKAAEPYLRATSDIPQLLLLAGSYQRGTWTAASDVDLVSILPSRATVRIALAGLNHPKGLAHYEVVRLAFGSWPTCSLRVMTTRTLRRIFDPAWEPRIWRASPTQAVTSLPESRARADGTVTTHAWKEIESDGGHVRRIVRHDAETGVPVATTEVSLILSGEVIYAFDLDDRLRKGVWEEFGLPPDRGAAERDPRFPTLADPRYPERQQTLPGRPRTTDTPRRHDWP